MKTAIELKDEFCNKFVVSTRGTEVTDFMKYVQEDAQNQLKVENACMLIEQESNRQRIQQLKKLNDAMSLTLLKISQNSWTVEEAENIAKSVRAAASEEK